MLDCQATTNNNKEVDTQSHCKYCQESGQNQTVYWGIQLDQDLLDTIISIYPDWFKDYNLNNMAEGSSTTGSTNSTSPTTNHHRATSGQCGEPLSPPKAEVDETPIQKSMDRNKESLKVKLMLRRPIAQLVDQGILPSLKTPPAFHEQRQKLERAKMGDLLKSKIQRRPDRQELIQQHILEDSKVDPSLQDRQRQLKKARLADDLNDRLSHRPGPLELIKGNILKTDEEFAQAVKEGQICFKKTSEGETRKHPPPMFVFEEDSSSEGTQSPVQDSDQSQVGSVPSVGETGIRIASPIFTAVPSGSVGSSTSPPSSISSPIGLTFSSSSVSAPVTIPNRVPSPPTRSSSSSKDSKESRNRKKSKSKSQPKARTIKFHEYKGPPNAQKSNATSAATVESSYDLLLQQQQLFLQWQLEWQHKYPQIILPAQKNGENLKQQTTLPGLVAPVVNGAPVASIATNSNCIVQDSNANRCLSKLEEMKVSDLKAELKKRNLPVSGSKPQLIQRLKPFSDMAFSITSHVSGASSESNAAASCSRDSASPSSNPDEMNLDLPLSPKKEVNNNTFPPCMSPDSSQDGTLVTRIGTNAASTAGQQSTNSTRPPSVAPMDVDVNCNPGFDAMDVTDAVANNGLQLMGSESAVTKLQRELQKECETWQVPEQNSEIDYYRMVPHRSPAQIQQATTVSLHLHPDQQEELQQKQTVQFTPPQTKSNSNPTVNGVVQSVPDPRTQQRLQQHLQQRLLQSQAQLQPQSRPQITVNQNVATTTNAKANLAAFLQGQIPTNVSIASANKGFFHPNNVNNTNNVSGDQHTYLNQRNVQKQIRNCNRLSNHRNPNRKTPIGTKANCVPNYGLISQQSKGETPFMITKPPPDYNEATKQLNKVKQEQFAQSLMNNLVHLPGQKSVKSQAVDEVLEVLIANGELPPSAAQDPATPTTPKSLPSAILFTNASSMSTTTDPLKMTSVQTTPAHLTTYVTTSSIKTSPPPPPPPPPPLPSSMPSVAPLKLTMPQMPIPSLGDVGLGSPDLDVNLDLDSFETMDIGQLSSDVTNPTNGDLSDHMEIDVSDWLDAMMPPATNLPPITAQNDADSGDPLLSNSQDPFDLFTIDENDFKTSTDLNILNWDKIDFAT